MYTDEFNDNQYDNTEVEETKTYENNGGNKIKLIVIGVLAVVLIVLIVLVLGRGKGRSKNNNYVLSLYPETITIPYGQTVNVSYDVRNNGEMVENPTVKLIIENDEIVQIDGLNLKGLSYGKTMLIASFVDSNGKTVQEMKEVTVADGTPGTTVTDVVIPEGDLQLPPTGTYEINLTIEPPAGYVENKKFTSSNSNVVTVDNTGKVTAVGKGEATIIIDINNGAVKKQLKVYVNEKNTTPKLVVSPTKITISDAVENIIVGDSKNLSYVIYPDEASKENIVWSSSDDKVLTINENGKITGVKAGEATIKVVTPNNISDSIKVKVQAKEIPVTDITLSVTELNLSTGQSETITPVVLPEDATDKTLMYSSSDTSIASVMANDGVATITALSAGNATITIKSTNDIIKTINVTVTQTEIIVDPGGSGGGGGGSSCKKTCPNGQYVSNCKCVTCEAGNYCKDGKKTACPSGYSSSAGASACNRTSCPSGSYLDSTYSTGCRPCPSGKYCSGGKAMPQTCANGKIPNSGKTGCQDCKINNCVTYGGGGTSCTCTKCQPNYVSQGSSCKYVGDSTTKSCASRGTVSECTASSSCKWDYTYGCRNK